MKTKTPLNGYAFIILGTILTAYGMVRTILNYTSDGYIAVVGLILILAGYSKLKN